MKSLTDSINFHEPEISILMPARNGSKHIRECLDSIINQTEKNWELIIVDDHSTDNTAEILKYYADKDGRIYVFSNTGKGIINALRLAFNNSKGKYISRMDADDIMPSNKLEILKSELIKNKRGTVVTGLVKYFSDGELMNGFKRYEEWLNGLCRDSSHYSDIYKECIVASPAWLMHRDDLTGAGGFDSDIYPEDYDLCFRWQHAGYTIKAANKIVHYWRDHPERASRNDDNYSSQLYLDIKIHYFLKNSLDKSKTLVLCGAGKKGKKTAKLLIDNKIDFKWVCNNPRKIESGIYGKKIYNEDEIIEAKNIQVIILISNQLEQDEVEMKLNKNGYKRGLDYFFFC